MEEGKASIESSGLLSYQQSVGNKKEEGIEVPSLRPKIFGTKALVALAGIASLAVLCYGWTSDAKPLSLRASMLDDPIPPPPPPPPADPNAVPPPPPPADPNAPPPPPPAPGAPPAPPAGPPAPEGPPPPTACQTGLVADAPDPPSDDNEMKACYLICDNTDGASACDVNTCKSACWFGNDFCYNSCMGGCKFQAVGLNNGSRMACDSETCFAGCSYQCQKQCNCGVQESGHCAKFKSGCMLDEAIPGQLIGATVNYLCSSGPSPIKQLCKSTKKLKPACRQGFGFAVALASYSYSYTMSTVPQTTEAGISAVAAACDFSGFGFIKDGAQHPCQLNFKGYGGKAQN
mmetsp:Transcript_8286/g.16275  ORF Transcript_8286/g.16275 Transcript_8286/m.16275 type:complete len:346 (-) Transcript_8286:437-1474(-)